jgi:hypothetical protein
MFQSIIGTAIYSEQGGGGGWIYPPPGNGYPISVVTQTAVTQAPVSGYYEASSVGTPSLGLYRRTFLGQAFGSNYVQDPDFPATYNIVQNLNDPAVGFGFDLDVATNFTMEWMGYFKPAQSGDFIFCAQVDDFFAMWIGQDAVSGFTGSNAIVKANNEFAASLAYPLIADKYYPVRLRFVENQGGHSCTIWSGLKGNTPQHNQNSAATGQFFYDPTFVMGFPGSGLIV